MRIHHYQLGQSVAGLCFAILAGGCVPMLVGMQRASLESERNTVIRFYDMNGDQRLNHAEGQLLLADLRLFATERTLNVDNLQLSPDATTDVDGYPLSLLGKDQNGKPYDIRIMHRWPQMDVICLGGMETGSHLARFVQWKKGHLGGTSE